jgi:Cu+-exporting ATPase
VASIFVPVVFAIAVVTFIIWNFVVSEPSFNRALLNFVSVLIISCPCAMGLATPTAIMVGTGLGAEAGILIKGGESLERAHRLDTVVFDKTGTITRGEPVVTDVVAADGVDVSHLIEVAASVESRSEHPLALAVVNEAKQREISTRPVDGFEALSGLGARAYLDGREIFIGKLGAVGNEGFEDSGMKAKVEFLADEGKTVVFVSEDKKPLGLLAFLDVPKKGAEETVEALSKMGLAVSLITGDNEKTAQAVGKSVGIDRIMAGVLPEEKSAEIRRLKSAGHVVAMVGDGINDAPALVEADIGISIGAGTDVAIEAGDITLIRDDLMAVPNAVRLSLLSMRVIKQNLFWAFFYNSLGIPIAAGILYPFFGILLSPVVAAAAMAMSSVSVVSNSLRLARVWKRKKIL